MAKLVVKKKKEWYNKAAISLFIDGEKVDTVGNGDIKELELASGKHTIYAKFYWHYSPEFEFELSEEKSKGIQISGYKLAKWIIPLTYILFGAYFIAKSILKIPIDELLYALIPGLLVSLYYTSLGRKK